MSHPQTISIIAYDSLYDTFILRRQLSPSEQDASIKSGGLAHSTAGKGHFPSIPRQWTKTVHVGLDRPRYSCKVRPKSVAWWSYRADNIAALSCIGSDPWLCPSPPSQPRQPSYCPYSRVSPSKVLDPLLVAPMEALKTPRSASLGQLFH